MRELIKRVYKNAEDDDHTFYLNQYYIVRNDAIISKHLFAGASRIVTRLVEPPEEDSEETSCTTTTATTWAAPATPPTAVAG